MKKLPSDEPWSAHIPNAPGTREREKLAPRALVMIASPMT
jgi:hypothetical protein